MSKHIYNLKLSPTANRTMFKLPAHIQIEDVPDTDYSGDLPFIFDQGQLGSCVFNACGMAAAHVDFVKNGTEFIKLARLAPYWQYRNKYNCINEDSGASGYDYCVIAKEFGVGPETLNLYDIDKFKDAPTQEYLDAALQNELISFQQIDVRNPKNLINMIRAALYHNKFGLPIGIQVPEDFESQSVMNSGEFFNMSRHPNYLGGHEVYVVGAYRHGVSVPCIRFANSWGETVGKTALNGKRGFFDISEDIAAKLIIEANVITQMES